VGKVVSDFSKELPESEIYVFDNGSEDRTADAARKAGAKVRYVGARGKGNVVIEMFRDIDADFYVMVDGDDTYPAEFVRQLLKPVMSGQCDMSVGSRTVETSSDAFRTFHRFGNSLVTGMINRAFGSKVRDVFSGYRVFNRKLVSTLPLLSRGFEIEAEFTLQVLDKGLTLREIDVPYRERPKGSASKLNTYTDGLLVIKTILSVIKDYRPFAFFSVISVLSFLVSVGFGAFVINEYLRTQKVFHPSTAVLAAALMIIAMLSMIAGLILDSTKRHYAEQRALILNQTNLLKKILEGDVDASDLGLRSKGNIS